MAASGAYAELQSALPEGCQLLTMDAVRFSPSVWTLLLQSMLS